MILVDVKSSFNITGKAAEHLLDEVGITTNKNMIPFDDEKPFVTSGIRMGTPALTSRGLNLADMEEIADIIYETLKNAGINCGVRHEQGTDIDAACGQLRSKQIKKTKAV